MELGKNELLEHVCEVAGCERQATENIVVGAGKYGPIPLYVCTNCKEFFKEDLLN